MTLWQGRVSAGHFGASALGCEHPGDAGAGGVALLFPGGNFGDEAVARADAAVEALAAQHADLDLNHVEPAGMLWGVVELQAAQYAVRLGCREGFIERAGKMRR